MLGVQQVGGGTASRHWHREGQLAARRLRELGGREAPHVLQPALLVCHQQQPPRVASGLSRRRRWLRRLSAGRRRRHGERYADRHARGPGHIGLQPPAPKGCSLYHIGLQPVAHLPWGGVAATSAERASCPESRPRAAASSRMPAPAGREQSCSSRAGLRSTRALRLPALASRSLCPSTGPMPSS